MEEIIRAEKISTGYRKGKECIFIHKELDFQLIKGQFISLIGHNGSGKSTLFKSISNILPLLSGNIFLKNKVLNEYSRMQLAQLLSIVVTDKIVNPNLKVREVVESGRYPYISRIGKLRKSDQIILEESIYDVGMMGFEDRKINTLSDGELQRVLIARALCQKTEIILLDEPSSHLDLEGKFSIMKLLNEISRKEEKTILLSTHDIDLALQTTDTLWLLDKERNLITGSPKDLVDSDILSKIFDNENFHFDKSIGKFIATK